MSNRRIRKILTKQLRTTGVPVFEEGRIAIDGNGVEVVPNDTHFISHLIPAPADSETLDGNHISYRGIFQATAMIKLGKEQTNGEEMVEMLAEKMQDAFRINALFKDVDGFETQVISPVKTSPTSRVDKSSWFRAHCYFNYRSDVNPYLFPDPNQ
jgi:hypothetical protein